MIACKKEIKTSVIEQLVEDILKATLIYCGPDHFKTLFQFEEKFVVLLRCVRPTWVINDTLLYICLSFDHDHGHKTLTKTNKSALCS